VISAFSTVGLKSTFFYQASNFNIPEKRALLLLIIISDFCHRLDVRCADRLGDIGAHPLFSSVFFI